ncbi:MAG: ABC transporter permease [Bryobacteraceae bacterium]
MKHKSDHWHSLIQLRDVVHVLIVRDMKLRYKRSVLGVLWSLLNPLLQLSVFYVVFRFILPVSRPHFAIFLFSGLLSWNWFQSSVQAGCTAITDHGSLVRQPRFNALVLPLVTVLSNLLHFLIALPILLIGAWSSGILYAPALLAIPVLIAAQLLLTLSLVYVLAALHVRLRDTQYLVGSLLLFAFYLSPVLYSTREVPGNFLPYFRLNPLVPILDGYHRVVVEGKFPEMTSLLIVLRFCRDLAGRRVRVQRASRGFVEEIGA